MMAAVDRHISSRGAPPDPDTVIRIPLKQSSGFKHSQLWTALAESRLWRVCRPPCRPTAARFTRSVLCGRWSELIHWLQMCCDCEWFPPFSQDWVCMICSCSDAPGVLLRRASLVALRNVDVGRSTTSIVTSLSSYCMHCNDIWTRRSWSRLDPDWLGLFTFPGFDIL